jgi:trans-2,3-dihydro-3-hydroxyanthranilate isomerase
MRYRFYTADVFTDRPFGGNQLAVIPDARGLTQAQMQSVTREFNYAESTFVLPPENPANTRRVRIFTPRNEIPFAGHPTVGTAFVLAAIGDVTLTGDETRIVLEEGVGPVPVKIRARDGKPVFAQLQAARPPEFGPEPPAAEQLAAAVSLTAGDLLPGRTPCGVTAGLPFLFMPVRDRNAVARARINMDAWERAVANWWTSNIFVFALGGERPGSDIHARMFAPGEGIPEDPATGSACAALGGLLAHLDGRASGTLRWIVEQGFEMGRPSILEVEADREGGRTTAVRVGGAVVMMSEGTIDVPDLS